MREKGKERKPDLRKILTSQPMLRSKRAETVCLKLGVVMDIQIVHSPAIRVYYRFLKVFSNFRKNLQI